MAKKLFNLFNDNPTLISHCPVCNLRFNPLEARVLEEKDNTHLVHIQCRHCQAAILALIIGNNLGISSIGLITDLNSDDVLRFKNVKAISCDDVIEVHQLLNQEKVLIDQFD
jgi:hypothetical protein